MAFVHLPFSFTSVVAIITSAIVGQAIVLQPSSQKDVDVETAEWIENNTKWLNIDNITEPKERTAIVTFAGLKNQEYIDSATMLGLSLQRHLPGHPRVALVIDGMKEHYQEQLTKVGWQLVFVENWEGNYCGDGCDQEFMGRWHDSFEKINTFRLPFGRVLFMDADTYVFSEKIGELLTAKELPEGHIAMSPDGCKNEYNSGVMLFRPNINTFRSMLALVRQRSRERILDQNIINEIYAGRIVELEREFNCVDTLGAQPGVGIECDKRCSRNVVVAHFTGHPKPTAAKRRLLELVRRPGAPALAARNTNFGSTSKWSEYYCDIRANHDHMSRELQHWLKKTGACCHVPYDPALDKETCKECPDSLRVKGTDAAKRGIEGVYMKSNIKPTKYNGMVPIYVKPDPEGKNHVYLYYVKAQILWMIGPHHQNNDAITYAGKTAQCPRDAGAWHFVEDGKWTIKPVSVKMVDRPGSDTSNATQPMLFDIQSSRWVPDVPEGIVNLDLDD